MNTGDRFYYTGDAANSEGEGKILCIETNQFGTRYCLLFDDGRSFYVDPVCFAPQPGRRLWPLEEWQRDRAAKLAALQDMYHATQVPR
jgi:hypothetical protein